MKPEELGAYYESILDKEARKEGGVYYTPQYIVDYIVEHTLGKSLKGKTPKEVARIKVVDPACGAGVFLLGAYRYLLNWHEKHSGKLTLTKRYKILMDNIFDVDIDPLAVDITKYCLSMTCTNGKDFRIGLDKNVRCGNSLVNTDIYLDPEWACLSEREQFRINAFDWNREFPGIIKQGSFDLVIGNPPNPHVLSQKDMDARWTQKNGVSSFGYKDHVLADEEYKYIRDYAVTDASVHDSIAYLSVLPARAAFWIGLRNLVYNFSRFVSLRCPKPEWVH